MGAIVQHKVHEGKGYNVPVEKSDCKKCGTKLSGKNMNASEDFMLLPVHTHVVAAARTLQSKNPSIYTCAKTLTDTIVTNFAHLPNTSDQATSDSNDGVHSYAVEVLSLGLLWHGFHDAIKEADGDRILRYWKFLLVIFKSTRNRNYAKEAVHRLHHYYYYYIHSDRQKKQLIWSRCINTQGRQGANIACDLHMEHLNRRLKNVLRGMSSNITPARVQRAGQSIQ